MSLVEAANLGFDEENLVKFIESQWKRAVFQTREKRITAFNQGMWGYIERWEESSDKRSLKNDIEVTFKGNIVWEMQRRGILGENFLKNYDLNLARKAINLLKQTPLFLNLEDLYKHSEPTEITRGEFKGMMYMLVGGRGEIGDFNCDEYILIELDKSRSDTLWTGGWMGGIRLT